ncbi:MAG: hypothetical protein GC136_05430 [Alphaproteobacteria bacterium]|nr:hypothetical protein [Alphaproteobacteria bacterium]
MKSKFDIIISGGGIPALLLALHAAVRNYTIALIEPFPPEDVLPPADGRTAAIMQEGMALINELPIWKEIQKHCGTLKTLCIIDRGEAKSFNASELGFEAYGYNVPLPLFRKTLWGLADKDKNITLLQDKINSHQSGPAHTEAALSSGHKLEAALLVAADGRKSTLRENAGIKTLNRDYHQSALTCLLKHSKPHNDTSTEFHRTGGPFTLVPLPNNHSSLVWMMPHDEPEKIKQARKPDIEKTIQILSENILGAIELVSGTSLWPIVTMHTNTLIAPRMVLLAETAHVVPPTGAQGLNISLADVIALLTCLDEAKETGSDIGAKAVLLKYERRRLPDIKTRVLGTQGLNELVKTKNSLLQNIRRAGLSFTHGMEPIRRLAMKTGLRTKNTAINSQ